MKQEDKELLLRYLSMAMPYGVFCDMGLEYPLQPQRLFIDKLDGVLFDFYEDRKKYQVYLSEIKPYLRPMSSMTEEEWLEFSSIDGTTEEWIGKISVSKYYYDVANYKQIDWLNANHFDYRGLIPKDLAIAITKENNPYK